MAISGGYKLIAAFVALIIGIVLLTTISTQTIAITEKGTVSNELDNLDSCVVFNASGTYSWDINISDSNCNFTVTNSPTGWKVADCPLESVTVSNTTGTAFTDGTDYNLYASDGIVQMLNASGTRNISGNNTNTDYTYCADDYLNSAFGRSSQNLVPGFFALALLMISIGLFYSIAKEYDIL